MPRAGRWWATRAQAVAEKAVLPVTFGALDGEASWLEGGKTAADPPRVGPHRLSGPYPVETTRPPSLQRCAPASLWFAAGGSRPRASCARSAGPSRAWHRAERARSGQAARGRPDRSRRVSTSIGSEAGCLRLRLNMRCGWPPRASAMHTNLGCFPPHGRALHPGHGDGLRGPDAPEVAVVAALTTSARGPGSSR